MPDTYDHITLMCRLKAAQRRNKELESGERYIQLEELYQKEYNVYAVSYTHLRAHET